jgi:hypothetical protein
MKAKYQWLTHIILATQKAEIWRITVQSPHWENIHETLSWKTLSKNNLAGGMAQGEGPEFKLQYRKKEKKNSWEE